jgi:hypothetical protein
MPGEGKYTVYGAPASDRNTLLNKLFRSNDPVVKPLTQDLVGKETDVKEAILEIAKTNLQPAHQVGDLGFFPAGVDLDFSGAPKTEDVKWVNPGDPENSYTPDISSPGPGKTDGRDKATDPQVKVTDLKPNYVPGAPGTGTKSPAATNAKIVAANLLGVPGKLGDSGGNV